MKLNTFCYGMLYHKLPKKWLLVMKLTFFLLLACFMTVSATTRAQKITLDTKDATLKSVLNQIKQQSGYYFVIDNDLLDNAKTVTLHLKNADIDEALKQIAQTQNLSYTFEGKVVTIKEKQPLICVDRRNEGSQLRGT